jgi:hypothetical protein
VNYFTFTEQELSYQAAAGRQRHGGCRMDAIANFLFHATGRNLDDETVQTIIILCGIGLFVSLLFLAYGLDLSPRFF